jgi:hypothetical protein
MTMLFTGILWCWKIQILPDLVKKYLAKNVTIFEIINNNTRKTGVLVLTLNNVSSRNHTRTQTDLIRTECTGHANPHLVQTLISINGVDSFTRDSSDVGHTGVFGRTRTNLKFFPRYTKAQVGRGRQESLSHCVVAAAGMSAVYKSRRPMSSAARRRRDDVAWPISQHAMLPAAWLLGKHGRQRRRRSLSRWSPFGSLRAPLFVKHLPPAGRQPSTTSSLIYLSSRLSLGLCCQYFCAPIFAVKGKQWPRRCN